MVRLWDEGSWVRHYQTPARGERFEEFARLARRRTERDAVARLFICAANAFDLELAESARANWWHAAQAQAARIIAGDY
jgi:hypothetical protein